MLVLGYLEAQDRQQYNTIATNKRRRAHYVTLQVREVLKHIKEHPFPAVTIFPDNRPHYFRRDNLGSWTPAELPNNNDSTPDANVQAAVQAVAATGAWTQGGGVTTTSAPPAPAALSPAPWGASVPHR